MSKTEFKTEIDPWADAMRGTRKLVKRPRKIKVLVITRGKDGKIKKAGAR